MIFDAVTLIPISTSLALTAYNSLAWPHDGRIGVPPSPVSVLVPARNEEANIEACVRGVMSALRPGDEMIVCDDGSSDQTPAILGRLCQEFPSLRVISGEPLPPGWVGKPHACAQLGRAARGALLLFVDSDVVLKPTALQRIGALLGHYDAGLLTMFPHQRMETLAELTVVPMLTVTFTSWLPLDWIHKFSHPRLQVCSGQMMAFRRDVYESVGGYAAVAGDVVDDVAMCMAVKRAGYRLVFATGTQSAVTRMYSSLSDVWQGFSKNMFEGMEENRVVLAGAVLVYLAAFVLPFCRLALELWTGSTTTVAMLAVLAGLLMRIILALRLRQPVLGALLLPFGGLMVVMIALNSMRWTRQGTVQWRGRTYGARDTRVRR